MQAGTLTYRSLTLSSGMELAPFLSAPGMTKFVTPNEVNGGCQGFIGPYPSAFLDKHLLFF